MLKTAVLFFFIIIISTGAAPAYAMHITEGFLPLPWAGLWWLLLLPALARGLRIIQKTIGRSPRLKLVLALAGAFAFVLSALKIPSVTGSCSHPTGVGLCAIVFGPAAATVIGFLVLVFQALLLAHGGITTLGANAFSMAVIGPLFAYGCFQALSRSGASRGLAVFFAALLGDLATYGATSVQLAFAFPAPEGGVLASLAKFGSIFALTQVPLAVSEGLLTVMVYNLLCQYAVQELALIQDIKQKAGAAPGPPVFSRNMLLLGAAVALAIVPILLLPHAEFSGADAQAESLIKGISPDYSAWFSPLWEPPSGEIESLLFALQAALGAGVVCYLFGFMRGRTSREKIFPEHLPASCSPENKNDRD